MKSRWLAVLMGAVLLAGCSIRRAAPGGTLEATARSESPVVGATSAEPGSGQPGALAPTVPILSARPTLPAGPGEAQFPAPTPAAPALPAQDEFLKQMQEQGYSLWQSGSLSDAQGRETSAYIFTRFVPGEPTGAGAFVIGFYRVEAGASRFMNRIDPPVYAQHLPAYPSYYRLVDWDDPQTSTQGLSSWPDWSAATHQALHLNGFAADINANGRPEFIVAAEYCPIACLHTALGFDVFEVQDDGRVIGLADGLPGRIRLPGEDPEHRLFDAGDAYWYGDASLISAPFYVTWDGGRFVNAGKSAAPVLSGKLAERLQQLKRAYGERYGREEYQAAAYNLLFGYESLGMRGEALDAFLEATDPAHWSVQGKRTLCWLQVARGRAQDEYQQGKPFTLPPALNASLSLYPQPALDELAAPLAVSGYDVSACH